MPSRSETLARKTAPLIILSCLAIGAITACEPSGANTKALRANQKAAATRSAQLMHVTAIPGQPEQTKTPTPNPRQIITNAPRNDNSIPPADSGGPDTFSQLSPELQATLNAEFADQHLTYYSTPQPVQKLSILPLSNQRPENCTYNPTQGIQTDRGLIPSEAICLGSFGNDKVTFQVVDVNSERNQYRAQKNLPVPAGPRSFPDYTPMQDVFQTDMSLSWQIHEPIADQLVRSPCKNGTRDPDGTIQVYLYNDGSPSSENFSNTEVAGDGNISIHLRPDALYDRHYGDSIINPDGTRTTMLYFPLDFSRDNLGNTYLDENAPFDEFELYMQNDPEFRPEFDESVFNELNLQTNWGSSIDLYLTKEIYDICHTPETFDKVARSKFIAYWGIIHEWAYCSDGKNYHELGAALALDTLQVGPCTPRLLHFQHPYDKQFPDGSYHFNFPWPAIPIRR